MRMMQTLLTPEPNEAQLSCMKAVDSLDWSMIRLLFACRCSVDWDVAGPFDSEAPIFLDIVQVVNGFYRVVVDARNEVLAEEKLGKSMQLECYYHEQDEEEMMFSEENVKHQEMTGDQVGVI